jgi:hypothetical protein
LFFCGGCFASNSAFNPPLNGTKLCLGYADAIWKGKTGEVIVGTPPNADCRVYITSDTPPTSVSCATPGVLCDQIPAEFCE